MRTARTARPAARRTRAARASLAVVAATSLALAGCSGADESADETAGSTPPSASAAPSAAPSGSATADGGSSEAAQGVADALAAGREAGSAAFDFSSETDAAGQSVVATGRGSFDAATGALSMQLSSQLPGQGEVALELRQVDDLVYVSGVPGLPPEQWVQLTPEELGAAGGPLGGADPSQQLTLLQQAGDVQEVGPEQVGGVETTHYRGQVDLAAAAEQAQQGGADLRQLQQQYEQLGLSTVPFDLYVGPDGLPVRTATSVETSAGDQQVSSTSTVDFTDWGADVQVAAPEGAVPLSEVTGGGAPTPTG